MQPQSFRALWEQSVQQHLPQGILKDEERQLLLEAAGAFCNSDTSLQNTLLEQYADRFLQQSNLADREYREKSRLYRRLTGAAGIFLILLLL
jgi:stage III sporulation protein AB